MPRIIRDTATAMGTRIAIVHTSTRMSVKRTCQQMTMAQTT